MHFAEFFLGLLGVLEAEGRALQENILVLTRRWLFLFLGFVFIGVAFGFFVCAVYKALILILSPVLALTLMGMICFGCALCFIWISALWKSPKKTDKNQKKVTQEP